MATKVARSAMTDDDGTGLTGTIWRDAELQKIYDNVDLLLSGTGAYATLQIDGDILATRGIVVGGSLSAGVQVAAPTIVGQASQASLRGELYGTILKYAEKYQFGVIVGNVLTVDLQFGHHIFVTLNANITGITIVGPVVNYLVPVMFYFTGAGGAYTVTFSITSTAGSGVTAKFPGGVAPTIGNTSGKIDVVLLRTNDAGASWLGDICGQNY